METSDLLQLLSDAFDFAAKTAAILLIAQRLSSASATVAERENLSRALGEVLEGRSRSAALRHTPGNADRRMDDSLW
jgi:hypothetical protein